MRVAGRSGAKKEPAALVLRPQIFMAGRCTCVDHFLGLNCGSFPNGRRRSATSTSPCLETGSDVNGKRRQMASGSSMGVPLGQFGQAVLQARGGRRGQARGRPATIYRDRGDSYDVDYLDGELEREEHLKRSDMLWNEAGTIRRKRRTFLEHQVIVAATEAACLMAAALCLMASYLAGAGGGFSGDTPGSRPLRAPSGGGNLVIPSVLSGCDLSESVTVRVRPETSGRTLGKPSSAGTRSSSRCRLWRQGLSRHQELCNGPSRIPRTRWHPS